MIPPLSHIRGRLRLRQLELIVALAERQSLRGAAQAMNVTQPAATKALREIERLLGASLFMRHARGMTATILGQAVTEFATATFDGLSDLRERLVAIEAGSIGRVRVGSVMAATTDLIAAAVINLKRDHPDLAISITVATSDILVGALNDGEIDVMVGRVPEGRHSPNLSFEPLAEEPLAVVVRTGHPHASTRDLHAIAATTWVLQPHPSPMRRIVDQAFIRAGMPGAADFIETASTLTTLALLIGSDMAAVMSASVAVQFAAARMIVILPVELPDRLPPYGIILRADRTASPAARVVADALRVAACDKAGLTGPTYTPPPVVI